MIRTKQGFVSPQDGSLEWKPGPENTTEYIVTVKQGAKETKLPSVCIPGECSIENIEAVLNDKQSAIQAVLGARGRNLREDVIRMARTQ